VDEGEALWSLSSVEAALWPSDSIAWNLDSQLVTQTSLQNWCPESGDEMDVEVGSRSERQP
jgi:hypothetical protein